MASPPHSFTHSMTEVTASRCLEILEYQDCMNHTMYNSGMYDSEEVKPDNTQTHMAKVCGNYNALQCTLIAGALLQI